MAANLLTIANEAPSLREPSSSDSRHSGPGVLKETRYRGTTSAYDTSVRETVRAGKLKLLQAADNIRKDAQRSRNLTEMSEAIFQLAHTLSIDLPAVRRRPRQRNLPSASMQQRLASNQTSPGHHSLHAVCEVWIFLDFGNTVPRYAYEPL
eukprot:jgi/Ulvmu1/519/UM001_0527.1